MLRIKPVKNQTENPGRKRCFGMEIRCALCGRKLEINKMDKNFEAVRQGKKPVIICQMCQRSAMYEAKKQVEQV